MDMATPSRPLIVGIGGTTKPGSSTEVALAIALQSAAAEGASIRLFDGAFLIGLPHYGTEESLAPAAGGLIDALREADGVILASPGYHGSISGLVKNAIDYAEAMAKDTRPYLDGIPVGLIVTAYGWQATGSTLATMRSIVHALRGWPTPLGVTINTSGGIFRDGQCTDPAAAAQLALVGRQVVEFARLHLLKPSITGTQAG